MATWRRCVWLMAALVLLVLPTAALAQQPAVPATVQPVVIDLEANGSAEVPIFGFCLEHGKPFPGASLRPAALAPDHVRATITYALGKGYVQSEPLQTQLAIWYFLNGNAKVEEDYGPVADEIIAAVEGGVALSETAEGAQLLTDAVAGGLVTATIDDFEDISPDGSYIGSGTLVLTNLTAEPIRILLPYGVQFTEEPYQDRQIMGIFPQQPGESAEPQPELPPTGGPLAPGAAALMAAVAGASALLIARARTRR
jgi:hypothetical protein